MAKLWAKKSILSQKLSIKFADKRTVKTDEVFMATIYVAYRVPAMALHIHEVFCITSAHSSIMYALIVRHFGSIVGATVTYFLGVFQADILQTALSAG